MQNYETIGVAVRQHDAIRFDVVRGDSPRTLFVAAEAVPALFDGDTVPLYRLGIADGYVIPEAVPDADAHVSASGRMVLLWLNHEWLQVPTRQLQVHYDRGLGETSKIVRKVEGVPSAFAATAARMAAA